MATVKDVDLGWRAMLENAQRLRDLSVTVSSSVDYAMFLEHGTRKMAARPFLAWTLWQHGYYLRDLGDLAWNYLLQRTRAPSGRFQTTNPVVAARALAARVVRDVQGTIDALHLVRTGALRASITAAVAGLPTLTAVSERVKRHLGYRLGGA